MPEIFNAAASRPKHTSHDSSGTPEIVSPQEVDRYSSFLSQFPPSSNPLVQFASHPLQTHFESQLDGEQIILLVRPHLVSQLKWFLIGVVLFFLPFLISTTPLVTSFPYRFNLFFMLGWYMIWFGYVLEAFLNWFFNVNILTDERVIDIDFASLLFQDVATTKIDNIEDVTSVTGGTLGSIFDYGNVLIQTAGATDQIEFNNVPYPAQINKLINELIVREEQEKVSQIGEAVQ